jgi:hypothetical protein
MLHSGMPQSPNPPSIKVIPSSIPAHAAPTSFTTFDIAMAIFGVLY